MRYNKINTCECTNGLGWGVSLFVQGCPIHCDGCFNPETWDFNDGKEYTDETENQIFLLSDKKYISRLSILGGEPLVSSNLFDLFLLCNDIKLFRNIDIWLWTGYTKEQLQERMKKADKKWPEYTNDIYLRSLLNKVDYLVIGPFIKEERDITLPWRGSRNQEVINLAENEDWINV